MIQTWLPLPDFKNSLVTLDDGFLTYQRLHVLELMEHFHAIPEEDSHLPGDYESHDLDGHPLVDMWVGYELQLIEYGLQACEGWSLRNKREDPLYQHLANHQQWANTEDATFDKPNWMGDIDFHLSHQAELLRRNHPHYSEHFLSDHTTAGRKLIWPQSNHA